MKPYRVPIDRKEPSEEPTKADPSPAAEQEKLRYLTQMVQTRSYRVDAESIAAGIINATYPGSYRA